MKQNWFKKWIPAISERETIQLQNNEGLHLIDFDMMIKGHVYERPTGKVRQCAVTVDGATRLVTSGDKVDKATYDALVCFNAIKPVQPKSKQSAKVAD
ncbi:MAG: hypothetical protein COA73_04530 [Candidatus Hydrogenedentota bacterium]|nr:MAG: hypothetical protein COA73_04530 [Candidatus Hydrogenedentota bacterium]